MLHITVANVSHPPETNKRSFLPNSSTVDVMRSVDKEGLEVTRLEVFGVLFCWIANGAGSPKEEGARWRHVSRDHAL